VAHPVTIRFVQSREPLINPTAGPARPYLNLGILAHVDAGKTTLTERLLYSAGVIDRVGSVDDGSTVTDFLPLERQRGITIKSAVASFDVGLITVNLIDTPGHPDFIAEVERVLNVLDGAVLVISAVEEVQPQTRVLMRTLQRLRIPTVLFINKIDRPGAQEAGLLARIAERLTPAVIPLGTTVDLGTRAADFRPFGAGDEAFVSGLADVLAAHDDALLAAYVNDERALSYPRLRADLAHATGRSLVHPVFFGSAIMGAGVDALIVGIEELLPARCGDADGPLSGTVFKVTRGATGEKIAYARIYSGTLRTRDRIKIGTDREGKVTAIRVFDRGTTVQWPSAAAGRIAQLWGLSDVRIGDTIGAARSDQPTAHFDPPMLEAAVLPVHPADKAALRVALGQIAEGDPLINVRQDDRRGEMYVSLYGEVQKEVVEATLALEYNLAVHFRETSVICVERLMGLGAAVERMGKDGNPFLATVGVRLEPASPGAGIAVRLEVPSNTVPLFIYGSTEEYRRVEEETVRAALREGLHGWQVLDCTVTITESDYASPSSQARDFRLLTPLVVMTALREAGTVVCEPIQRFRLQMPADTYGTSTAMLLRLGAVVESTAMDEATCTLQGQIAAAQVHVLQRQIPSATRGEGLLECEFDSYRPIAGPPPSRPRTDLNPLDRKEYLLHVTRRV
jgi:ribosomal protection tetracycline resistance protein